RGKQEWWKVGRGSSSWNGSSLHGPADTGFPRWSTTLEELTGLAVPVFLPTESDGVKWLSTNLRLSFFLLVGSMRTRSWKKLTCWNRTKGGRRSRRSSPQESLRSMRLRISADRVLEWSTGLRS